MAGCLGFKTFSEFHTCVTFILLGMSIMMVPSAITSAPGFVVNYYMYATGDPNAVCEKPFFWNNANTFYNVGTYVMQVIMELFCLTPIMRRVPLSLRLYVGLIIPILEMLLFVVVPVAKLPSQDGAIAVLMVVSVMGGFSKALVDSTTGALVGPFPTKFMNAEQWGLALISLAMSVIQCILKVSMGTTFTEVLSQSRIYFGIGMAIQVLSLIDMAFMHRNPHAQQYVAEFRVAALKKQEKEGRLAGSGADVDGEPIEGRIAEDQENAMVSKALAKDIDGDGDEVRAVNESMDEEQGEQYAGPLGNAAVLRAKGDADRMVDADQTGRLTSSDQMLRVHIFSVIKRIWPMLGCTFLIFFTSLFLFPGLFFRIDGTDEWFSTIVALLFNVGDCVARILLMVPMLRPSPVAVVSGTMGRLLIIPLLVLCVRGIIGGHWMPFILVSILGLTNGFFGAMACIHCPRTTSLRLAGERSLAAMLSGVCLMLGLCAGSNFALLLNLTI